MTNSPENSSGVLGSNQRANIRGAALRMTGDDSQSGATFHWPGNLPLDCLRYITEDGARYRPKTTDGPKPVLALA